MKKTFSILFIMCTIFAYADIVDNKVNGYFSTLDNNIISVENFIEKVKTGDDMTIIDIRSAVDYNKSHIKGAVNIPWGSFEMYKHVKKIPQSGDVFVYCYSGQTAGQTIFLLNFVGIPAKSVKYGWKFGLSKNKELASISGTKINKLDGKTNKIDSELLETFSDYCKNLKDAKGTQFANNMLSVANAKEILNDNDEDVTFVSIRKSEDYNKGHIKGAINIPWKKGMQESFESLDPDNTIIVYCYSGQTAAQTVAGLRLLGYDAISLKGGMGTPANKPFGWKNKGKEIVK